MATVGTYLNFQGEAEAAFTFYKSVFGTEFTGEISRFGDMPPHEGQPAIPGTRRRSSSISACRSLVGTS